MSITADNVAAIVATILRASTATAYAPSDPRYGIIVIPDETWLGTAHVAHVRIDGLSDRGYVTDVEIQTSDGILTVDIDPATPASRLNLPARIRDAINAVVTA